MTLSEAMAPGRPNNLHALRLGLAGAVILSHAWPLAQGAGTPEPLETLTGHSLGGWAVAGFFFLSGLLISRSAQRHGPRAFWMARARRLLPGLGFALIVTLMLAAASGAELTPGNTTAYVSRGLTLVSLEHHLPGAFSAAPMPGLVNGPLWSLAHEVAAYALCFGAVRLGLLRHRGVLLAAALGLWALPDLPGRLATFAPLFLAFAFGMLAQAWDRLSLSPLVTLGLLALAPLGWPFAVVALGHGLLVLAFRLPARPLRQDLSYGLYLMGWPVAQSLMHHLPGLSAPVLALCTLAATLPLAWASWHLVERPLSLSPQRA
ncbi:acyltransferase family protein [Stagnihabitans tardus]|uniref:Acyltransferase family protein n=1 Tax=Stagnihabitans tardus TaxID=2699202 RepID=A0AAE5BVP5_9RHOB|nr:acyltransferase [Stagnihabitans tardus]NBZ89181.1 acyltransferase family protein [Stagnihabitans tardus]